MMDVFIRRSEHNIALDKIATLTQERNLIFDDEGNDVKAHLKTAIKFSIVTAISPLITLARLVRSAVFLFTGEFALAGREFIGALAYPLLTSACFVSTLASTIFHVISSGTCSFYVGIRRTYAYFEAWVNKIDLQSRDLPSYSSRVSSPTDFFKKVWTTAPCMQPLLENGESAHGGLLDKDRMQKIFPFVKVNGMRKEGDKVVIQSEYVDESAVYTACNGAYVHMKKTTSCCCFRIEAVYDRFLCCQVAKGSCTSMADHGDSCGFSSCTACGVGVCCCYATSNHQVPSFNAGCIGTNGMGYPIQYIRA